MRGIRWGRSFLRLRARRDYLIETIAQSDEVRLLTSSPGWSSVTAFLDGYRAHAEVEFRAGRRSPERYKADLDVLDDLMNGLHHLATMGDRAREDLAKIDPLVRQRQDRFDADRRAQEAAKEA